MTEPLRVGVPVMINYRRLHTLPKRRNVRVRFRREGDPSLVRWVLYFRTMRAWMSDPGPSVTHAVFELPAGEREPRFVSGRVGVMDFTRRSEFMDALERQFLPL